MGLPFPILCPAHHDGPPPQRSGKDVFYYTYACMHIRMCIQLVETSV